MNPTHPDPGHDWASARLELHHAGLLGPEGDALLLAHAAGCERCADALRAQAEDARAEHGTHVPASVLARWPALAAALGPLERELVESHLADCAACREDARLAREVARPGTGLGMGPARVVPLPWRGSVARAGAAVVAAVAGLVVLWWWSAGPHEAPVTGAVTGHAAILVGAGTPGAIELRDVTRGGTPAPPVTLTPRRGEPVTLAFEPLDVADDTPVDVVVASASGTAFVRTHAAQRMLRERHALRVGDVASPLPDGDWTLRVVAWPGTARADSQVWAFRVRRGG